VADPRLDAVAQTVRAPKVVPDTIAFHDIAGLGTGAHRGEGLGNPAPGQHPRDRCDRSCRPGSRRSERRPSRSPGRPARRHRADRESRSTPTSSRPSGASNGSRTAKSGDRRAVAETQSFSQLIEALPSWSGPLGPCRPHALEIAGPAAPPDPRQCPLADRDDANAIRGALGDPRPRHPAGAPAAHSPATARAPRAAAAAD
jgi:hypothetical protein